jgi:hypothetical protein
MRRHDIAQVRLAQLVSACPKSPICIGVEGDASVDDLFRTLVSRSYILPFSQEKPTRVEWSDRGPSTAKGSSGNF